MSAAYHACPFCRGPKGCEEKQACNRCWEMLPLSAKRTWYMRLWAEIKKNPATCRAWFEKQVAA